MSKEPKITKTKNDPPVSQVQSLTRGLKLLEKISENKFGVALTDLALQVGLPNSTTHRLLMTMQQQGFVMQKGDLGLWCIGVRAFTVGSAFFRSRDLMTLTHPIMHKLMEKVGETINLSVFDHTNLHAVLIGQVECAELMRMVAPIGGHLPLHASGGGKVFLAAMDDIEVATIIQKTGLVRFTEYTIDTQADLTNELNIIRQQGYAFDNQEHALGLHCIAAPIFDENKQVIAAISISGPTMRITNEKVIHFGSLVIQAAEQINKMYSGS